MANIQQICLIAVFVLVPFLLLIKKKDKLLFTWILITASFEILAAMKFTNITAFKICGFVLLPNLFLNIKILYKNPLGKILIAISLYLFIITLFFVFVSPWPDTSGARGVMDLPLARGLKQLGTYISELSIAFYLSQKMLDLNLYRKGFYIIFYCALIMCFSLYAEYLLRIDFYSIATEGRNLLNAYRMRGFSHEPRAAAQIIAYGILILLSMNFIKSTLRKILFLLFLISTLYLAKSMSASIMLAGGIAILLLCNIFINSRWKKSLMSFWLPITFVCIISYAGFYILPSSVKQDFSFFTKHFQERSYIINSDNIDESLEVPDQCAYSFLKNNPIYALTGVGFGQSGLACTPYLLEKWRRDFSGRIDMNPFMGFMYQLIQGGTVILILWSIFFIRGWMILYKRDRELFVLSLVFTGMYLLQMRFYFPITIAVLLSYAYKKEEINVLKETSNHEKLNNI